MVRIINQQPPQRVRRRTGHIIYYCKLNELPFTRLVDFCSKTLRHGDVCVVIARQTYIDRIARGLRDQGIDLSEVERSGQYMAVAAEKMQSRAGPAKGDVTSYRQALTSIVSLTEGNGRPIRALGEALKS